jgi:GntR family transcriptional regulator, rspAB operon transcriptional repressor
MIVHKLVAKGESEARSLGEFAYELLVAKITRLELPPGVGLIERSLIAQLGVGRTPIREALQRLSAEGLVCHLPHRGMFVCEIDEEKVRHIFEFRSMVDSNMVKLAAARASEMHIHELERLDSQFLSSIRRNDIDSFVKIDRRFHEALAKATQNNHIEEVVPRIFNQQLRLLFFVFTKTGDWRQMARSHEQMAHAVIDAMSRHQQEEAELAMRLYLIRQQQEINGLL